MVRRSRFCSVNSRSRSCIRTDAGSFRSSGGSNDMKSNFRSFSACCARVCVTMAALVALAAPVLAQTTGRLVGTVVDAQGGVLPGVTVTVTSPQLQGANTAVTDASGQFRFPSLPPGMYTVKADLAGFKPVEQSDVRITIDQTVTLPLKMLIAGLAETVNVLGTSPVVDTTSAAGGISAGQDVFNNLPVARDFYGITKLAPGRSEEHTSELQSQSN